MVKLAPPFQQVEFDILYGRGICHSGELLDLAEQKGLVQRAGSWYSLGEQRLGQGRERAREFLRDSPDERARLVQLISGADVLSGGEQPDA